MTIRICTHPTRCEGMAAAHSVMAGQLADAWREAAQLTARLEQRDAEVARLQGELQAARDDCKFHYDGFVDKCKEATG